MTHHPTTNYGMYIGFWFTCSCHWSSPSFHDRQLARMAYEAHLSAVE